MIAKAGIFTVVLTGGIASGKTMVSDHFSSLGVPVIDTDVIARDLVEPGQPALAEIARAFGNGFLTADGRLDRDKMRQAIFADTDLRRKLEQILHPKIAAETLHRIEALDGAYCILVIPLYSSSERYRWTDRVLVVDVDEEIQIERVMARDGVSRQQALAILDAQASRPDRLALADDVIDNGGSLEELREQVVKLHHTYLVLSEQQESE